MKQTFALAVLAVSLVSTAAHAYGGPYVGLCAEGFASDSFGRGIESAVLGGDRRSKLRDFHDEGCYQLGQQYAGQTPDLSGTFCRREFNDGRKEGLVASPQGAGVACYVLGYQAGRADLDIGAREGDKASVGDTCVANYGKGVSDFKAGRAATQPDFDNKQSTCYSAGYFDASYN